MSEGSYGIMKGLPSHHAFVDASEVIRRQREGPPMRLIDVRPMNECTQGVPLGSTPLDQGMLMFGSEQLKPILEELTGGTHDIFIMGYGTDFNDGRTKLAGYPQAEPFTCNLLHIDWNVSKDRMFRIREGINGWVMAGGTLVPYGSPPDFSILDTDEAIWRDFGLEADEVKLVADEKVGSLVQLLKKGRPALMERLKVLGFGLARRQQLATFLSKATRDGRIPSPVDAEQPAGSAVAAAPSPDLPVQPVPSPEPPVPPPRLPRMPSSTCLTFKVVACLAKVRKAPNTASEVLGTRTKGDLVHVAEVLQGWARLRPEEASEADSSGFMLIDGTHLGVAGVGVLLEQVTRVRLDASSNRSPPVGFASGDEESHLNARE